MFDIEKQKILIELLLGNAELFARCNSIIKPNYFDPSLKKSVAFIQDFFETYKEIPKPNIVKAETGLSADITSITKAEQEYVSVEIEKFCQVSAAIDAVFAGPDLIEKGDLETVWQNIKAAASISLNKDLGISYFDNVSSRLRDLLDNSPTMSTGWADVDEALGGGIARQEMLLFAAASGVGKSICMANLAVNLVEQGYNGIYFSLELADRVVAKRFDSMVTKMSQGDILKNIEEVAARVNRYKNNGNIGELFIKRMPESVTTANHIRAYIKEFRQAHPQIKLDFIAVDYVDLMATNRGISGDNIWLADKYKSEELRAIGAEEDCAVITASQLGRASWEAERIGQQHIQGGISKIQTCDSMIAIIQSEQMRAAGEYMFEFVKTRNSGGVGSQTALKWDPIALRVTTLDDPDKRLTLVAKSQPINTILNTNNSFFGAEKFNNSSSEKPNLLDLVHRK